MASKVAMTEVRSLEEQAIARVNKWESAYAHGAHTNLTKKFAEFRERAPVAGVADPIVSSKTTSPATKTDERQKKKIWLVNKTTWDVDFKTMDVTLQELKDLYDDKTVIQFDKGRRQKLNQKIASKMKSLESRFASIKKDIDELNRQLYKTKDVALDYFDDVQEWRLVERITTDLTTRLQQKQQSLNRIILADRDQKKYIQESMPSHVNDGTAVSLQKLFDDFEKEQLENEEQEVQEIVNAVRAIVKMVNQMATMITEQGTIIDRIDYNLEVASARTLKGEHYFQKAEQKNKQAGYMALWCVGVLTLLNSVLGVIIMYKLSDS